MCDHEDTEPIYDHEGLRQVGLVCAGCGKEIDTEPDLIMEED